MHPPPAAMNFIRRPRDYWPCSTAADIYLTLLSRRAQQVLGQPFLAAKFQMVGLNNTPAEVKTRRNCSQFFYPLCVCKASLLVLAFIHGSFLFLWEIYIKITANIFSHIILTKSHYFSCSFLLSLSVKLPIFLVKKCLTPKYIWIYIYRKVKVVSNIWEREIELVLASSKLILYLVFSQLKRKFFPRIFPRWETARKMNSYD